MLSGLGYLSHHLTPLRSFVRMLRRLSSIGFARISTLAVRFSSSSAAVPPLVSCEWLHKQLGAKASCPKVVDASWYLPAMKRNGRAEYLAKRIPTATFFDIDATDDTSNLPHMVPSAAFFSQAMMQCGVSNADHVVVYDGKGLFSAARLWWMLRAFGHERVSVLDGGLPAWVAAGLALEEGSPPSAARGAFFTAALRPGAVTDAARLLDHVTAPNAAEPLLVVDARPAERFEGIVVEVRPGCRSGHIPGSRSVPFGALLEPSGKMRPPDELRAVFDGAGVALDAAGPPLVTSCGSGVTAAVVMLGLAQLGRSERVSLYDGSWAEWGSDPSKPLATGPA